MLYNEIIQKLIDDGLKTDHIQLAFGDADGFWDDYVILEIQALLKDLAAFH